MQRLFSCSSERFWLAKVLQQSEAKFWAESFWFSHPCFLWMKLCYLGKLHQPPKCWVCTVILAGVRTRFILDVDEYCINCLIHLSLGIAMHCWAYTDMVPSWISVIMGRPPVLANCSVTFSDISWSMASVFPKFILQCLSWKIVIKILWRCLIVSCVIDPVYFHGEICSPSYLSYKVLVAWVSRASFYFSLIIIICLYNSWFYKACYFGGIIFVQHL